jgi:ankyrin repeat protein
MEVHMPEQTNGSASASAPLPEAANHEWLRKHAKQRLREMRRTHPGAKLTDAQFELARHYGFSSWRALKAHIDSLTVEGQLFEAARTGDVKRLSALLDAHPDKLQARAKPYGATLLHLGAQHFDVVDLLLRRGLDANARETGDNTYTMHWAAAAGRLDIVRRLADAGGDVIGRGDDHELEVIGWASCWQGSDDDDHRAVVDYLLSRGARHHIFSAIAMNRADEVRRIVADQPAALNRRMSRNEGHQLPLQFAVRMNRPEIVALLVELGADPLGVDESGFPAAVYAMQPDIDRPVMEAIRAMTSSELTSAERGHRRPNVRLMDLLALLALGAYETAERLWSDDGTAGDATTPFHGALHIMAKRGDTRAVRWLLDHGVDPNGRWAHWEADVTPLHLAALAGHPDVARILLERGADPRIRDSMHDSDALGWAEFFGRADMVRLLSAVR